MVHVIWEGFKLMRKNRGKKSYISSSLLKINEFMKWTKTYCDIYEMD